MPYFEALYLMVTAMIGIVFICGGIQGYQAGVGDLRGAGMLEWPLRVLLIARRPRAGHAGRRHHAAQQHDDGARWRCAILVPTVLVALLLVRRGRAA